MRESTVEWYLHRQVVLAGGDTRKLTGRKNDQDRIVLWPKGNSSGGFTCPASVHFIEVKRPGKKPNAGQQRRIDKMLSQGFITLCIADKTAVDAYIKSARREPF